MMTGVISETNLPRMLGVWSGRIIEERESDAYNRTLLTTLKGIHDKLSREEGDAFVNIADPDHPDPVVRDAWKTLGWQIKQDAAEIFGQKDYLPVRRDMVKDAFGYRAASLTDPWTGISRWTPETQRAMKSLATGIMKHDAYKRLAQTEGVITEAVSWAKTTYVVRSLVVIRDNLLSNVLHLAMHGIGPVEGAKAMRDKFLEITQYVKNGEEIIKLRADLVAEQTDPRKARELRARIQSMIDANERLSIQPLLKAGEFTTVAEGLDEDDLAIREGGLGQVLDRAMNKLPGSAKRKFRRRCRASWPGRRPRALSASVSDGPCRPP